MCSLSFISFHPDWTAGKYPWTGCHTVIGSESTLSARLWLYRFPFTESTTLRLERDKPTNKQQINWRKCKQKGEFRKEMSLLFCLICDTDDFWKGQGHGDLTQTVWGHRDLESQWPQTVCLRSRWPSVRNLRNALREYPLRRSRRFTCSNG